MCNKVEQIISVLAKRISSNEINMNKHRKFNLHCTFIEHKLYLKNL